MSEVPVPINWVHYSLQARASPPWIWVRSDSFEDADEPELRVYTSWEETVSSFISLVEEYALKSDKGEPCLKVVVGSLEYLRHPDISISVVKWVFTMNEEESGNFVIADNMHRGDAFDATKIADELLVNPNNPETRKGTVTPVTLGELLEMPWDAVHSILYPPLDPDVQMDESTARQQPECRTIVNIWGESSSEHDFFIYAYPVT